MQGYSHDRCASVAGQVIRVQPTFRVIDAVPYFFWRGLAESAHVRPLAIRLGSERTPPHPPWVLQFELWRHWLGHVAYSDMFGGNGWQLLVNAAGAENLA